MLKINLGCGWKKYDDCVNIDIDPKNQPDIVRDLERGLPFSDNTAELIVAEHVLEHINTDQIHFVMREIWRVLIDGGKFKAIVPIGKGWQNNPDHKTHFEEHSDIFFTKWNEPYKTGYEFKLVEKKVIRDKVNDLGEDSIGFGDELRMVLEAVK